MTEGFVERRKERRTRTLLGGRAVYNDRSSTLDCLVRDLAGGGAHLRFGDTPLVPEVFDLKITGKGGERRVRRVWQRERDMGITFE